jgi:hypothetical protein
MADKLKIFEVKKFIKTFFVVDLFKEALRELSDPKERTSGSSKFQFHSIL